MAYRYGVDPEWRTARRTRRIAAGAGLAIEVRESVATLMRLRTGATAAGVLLALGILAMTVGLIRGEAVTDLRTLTATGASPRRAPHADGRDRRRPRLPRRCWESAAPT